MLAATLAVVYALLPAGPVTAQDADGGCETPGRALPVVLVHGFSSFGDHPFADFKRRLERHRLDFAPVLFDYRKDSTRWVTHPTIAPRLRRLIICLADESAKAGGIGRVAIVAHSMGGLATRQALAASPDDGRGQLSDEIAVVATLGTPHEGSTLAGPIAKPTSLSRPFWDFLTAVLPVPRTHNPAGRALARGSRELGELPPFPDDLAVFASAGEFVGTARLLFYERDVRIGDVIVDSDSATAQHRTVERLGGTDVAECDTLLPLDLGGAGVAAAVGLTMQTNPQFVDCFHVYLPNSRQHLNPIVAQLAAASARPARTRPTEIVEVVPVDADGNPQAGWAVEQAQQDAVFCTDTPSPSAVSEDIAWCSPSGADACWVVGDRTTVMCAFDPWGKKLTKVPLSDAVPPVPQADDPLPWGLELADGRRCLLRTGGAWGGRADGLIGWYNCSIIDGNGDEFLAVLAPQDGPPIDDSAATWTVDVGTLDADPAAELPPPTSVDVAVGYYASSQ